MVRTRLKIITVASFLHHIFSVKGSWFRDPRSSVHSPKPYMFFFIMKPQRNGLFAIRERNEKRQNTVPARLDLDESDKSGFLRDDDFITSGRGECPLLCFTRALLKP